MSVGHTDGCTLVARQCRCRALARQRGGAGNRQFCDSDHNERETEVFRVHARALSISCLQRSFGIYRGPCWPGPQDPPSLVMQGSGEEYGSGASHLRGTRKWGMEEREKLLKRTCVLTNVKQDKIILAPFLAVKRRAGHIGGIAVKGGVERKFFNKQPNSACC